MYFNNDNDPLGGTSSPYSYTDESFGAIEYPEITSLAIEEDSKPSFAVLGQFEDSPTSVNIYQVEKPRETLGSTVKAKDLAETLNFNSSSINQETTLKWSEGGRELVFNKLTQNSSYRNNVLFNSELNKPEFLDIEEINTLTNSLASSLKFQLSQERRVIEYLTKAGNAVATTDVASNADFVRSKYSQNFEIVSLRTSVVENDSGIGSRAEALDADIYFNDINKSSYMITVSNEERQLASNKEDIDYLVSFENNELQIDSENVATYPLKSIENAWEEVKDGEASLKYLVKDNENAYSEYNPMQVSRFIVDPDLSELGFFAPDEWKGYIYPIYVFRGSAELANGQNASFIFYVKAIED
ncbi:hypothetical protein GF389_00610 [Candidatus Dojkabacteria bacterium]|nr:hypothetical protein [Candidatus Dojkabacteria bacterium]